uniref:Uncharacterized protein n=1 Tax=Rhizophora mucronata TaxID=61149 RepID=A0A2P2MXJ8_RHIMU
MSNSRCMSLCVHLCDYLFPCVTSAKLWVLCKVWCYDVFQNSL